MLEQTVEAVITKAHDDGKSADYGHPCKNCDCPDFLGGTSYCERQSCLHSWSVHE